MDVDELIAGWKQRLTAVAIRPDYVYRDTPQDLIDAEERRHTTFQGFSEGEVADCERQLDVVFPAVFRAYLRHMAKSPGNLFCGSDLPPIGEFDQERARALELITETDKTLVLPPKSVVYLSHQGYVFEFILGVGGEDGPQMAWMEGDTEPVVGCPTFAERVESEIALKEEDRAESLRLGGYYLTLHPDGGSTRNYPALDSGERPLGPPRPAHTGWRQPRGKAWWQFWR